MSDREDWPVGRKALRIVFHNEPLPGGSSVGDLTASLPFHGEYDVPWIIERRDDGSLIWHNATKLAAIEWQP